MRAMVPLREVSGPLLGDFGSADPCLAAGDRSATACGPTGATSLRCSCVLRVHTPVLSWQKQSVLHPPQKFLVESEREGADGT